MGRHHASARPRIAGRGVRLGVGAASAAGAVGAGLLQLAVPALAAPAAAPAPATVSATPCAITAKACVSITQKKAWLTDGKGHVIDGPVPVTTGGPGFPTPTGTFSVMWKDKNHTSDEYDHAPMNNSVFFAPGDAFHEGSLQKDSAGCVHLSAADSEKFFDNLQPYDQVQILP